MIRQVDFLSLTDAECLPDRSDLVVISIGEGAAMPARLRVPEDRVLRVLFHDIDPEIETYLDGLELFDSTHAGAIIDWVRQWHDQAEPVDVVCHCRSGRSRSAAVALWIAESTGCAFPRQVNTGEANQHVLRVLRTVDAHRKLTI